MVDIHTHILPGVDDGPETLEEAVAMVEMAARDGTTCMVATPHCNDRYTYSLEQNRKLLAELAVATGGRVEFAVGCDFHLSYQNLQVVLAGDRSYTINQGPYLLVEFANFSLPPQLPDMLHQMRVRGLIPVITHPERNPFLQRQDSTLLQQLIAMGCPVQVTAGAVLGRFGPRAQEAVEAMLNQQMVHLVASDAHGVKRRSPRLSEAFAAVERGFGADRARALFRDNPRAVVAGESLPYFPEPAAPVRTRGWFSFFGS